MTHRNCLYFVQQNNDACYYMTFIRNKQADGVICGKFYRKYKYCPYHPKNKEKKNVYKRA
jgi:hypothetical protein